MSYLFFNTPKPMNFAENILLVHTKNEHKDDSHPPISKVRHYYYLSLYVNVFLYSRIFIASTSIFAVFLLFSVWLSKVVSLHFLLYSVSLFVSIYSSSLHLSLSVHICIHLFTTHLCYHILKFEYITFANMAKALCIYFCNCVFSENGNFRLSPSVISCKPHSLRFKSLGYIYFG